MSHVSLEPRKGMPSGFYAGDTVKYTISDGRYTPLDGWNASVHLSGPTNLTVAGSTGADSGSWDFVLPNTKTSLLKEGVFEFQHRVTSGSEAYTIDAGRTRVRASLIDPAIESRLTNAQRMFSLVEAAIEYRLTGEGGIDDISIAGQSVKHMDILQLRELRAQYQREIDAQLYAKGRRRNRRKNISTIFTRPE